MGCVASKLEEEEVVSICRERKRFLKLAVERRYLLADAHCRYYQALYAVAAAIKLFEARHSSPSSPFLITFPPPSPPSPPIQNVISNPMFLQQEPSESTQEAIACDSVDSSTPSDSSEEEEEEEEEEEKQQDTKREEQVCGYFYMQMPPSTPSPQKEFGWDFFNPFDGVRPEVISGYSRFSEDDLRVVREEEGIPELEDEGDRGEEENNVVVRAEEKGNGENEKESGVEVVGTVIDANVGQEEGIPELEDEGDRGEEENNVVVRAEEKGNGENEKESGVEVVGTVIDANVGQEEQKGLTVIDTPARGRELLDALKDIEDHFIRAYDSGKDVSRMLEASRVHMLSGLEEIKGNSTKLIQAITWHRSSSRSSSCKSLVASSSKSSSTWTEYKNDLFDDCGGMNSGSHSLTLGRLYAWEKKLYDEVKAGDSTRKIYERKCSQLRNKDVRGDDELSVDKTRAAVKDLYARILVAIRSAESISKRIQKLRDEELQPQIMELLKGLMQTWKIMLESHQTQNQILFEVKSFTCPSYGKFCNESHRLATLQLEAELLNWRACFGEYIMAQKAYIEALHGWLSKFVVPEVEFCSRGRRPAPPCRANGPPLLITCHDWLSSLQKLPDETVSRAMKSFGKDIKALWVHQGEEQQQKRKVDGLAKELDRRILAFQKAENRVLEFKLSEQKPEPDGQHQDEYLTEKRDLLDMFRRKLDVETEKHHNCMQETQRVTLNGIQTGFSSVFESLTEFCKASLKMYNDLVNYSENAEKAGNPSYIEGGSQVEEEDGSR